MKKYIANIKSKVVREFHSKTAPGEFLVKVQQSLASNIPGDPKVVLIYNRDHSIEQEYDDPATIEPILNRLGDRPKAYFNAQLNETGIKLLEEVGDPGSW